MVKQSDIATFVYEGDNSMLGSFSCDSPVPKCHPDFKAQLKLKEGTVIDAPPTWRRKIWVWWIMNHRDEVMYNVMVQASNDMLGRNKPCH
jgi:hypothetical protein